MRPPPQHRKLVRMLKETIGMMCKNSLQYAAELDIEGLIGITLDKKEVFLVKLDECYQPVVQPGSSQEILQQMAQKRKGSDGGLPDGGKRRRRRRKKKSSMESGEIQEGEGQEISSEDDGAEDDGDSGEESPGPGLQPGESLGGGLKLGAEKFGLDCVENNFGMGGNQENQGDHQGSGHKEDISIKREIHSEDEGAGLRMLGDTLSEMPPMPYPMLQTPAAPTSMQSSELKGEGEGDGEDRTGDQSDITALQSGNFAGGDRPKADDDDDENTDIEDPANLQSGIYAVVKRQRRRRAPLTIAMPRKEVRRHKPKPLVPFRFQCYQCGKLFKYKAVMKRHIRSVHIAECKFKCPVCDLKFRDNYLLENHVFAVHDGKHLKCDMCDATFKTQSGFKLHVDAHKGIFKFKCEHCGQGFYSRNDYRGHIAKHTGLKEYMCQKCHKCFSHSSSMARHTRICGVTEKKFSCHICGKMFKNERYVKNHLESKHRDDEIQCFLCGKLFTSPEKLKFHMQKEHV